MKTCPAAGWETLCCAFLHSGICAKGWKAHGLPLSPVLYPGGPGVSGLGGLRNLTRLLHGSGTAYRVTGIYVDNMLTCSLVLTFPMVCTLLKFKHSSTAYKHNDEAMQVPSCR